MNISGINNNFVNSAIDNAKAQSMEGDFEATLKKALDEKDDEQLKKVCTDFESIMLNMMYKQMKSTVTKSELIPEESGREMFESMLDDELVNQSSQKGDIGLGDLLYKQMKKQLANVYKREP
jgi:flagellar protein FlgJ